jgi:hypothetical protein
MLAAVAALAAGGLAQQTSRPVHAGTDGDLILGVNNVLGGGTLGETKITLPGSVGFFNVFTVDASAERSGGTTAIQGLGGGSFPGGSGSPGIQGGGGPGNGVGAGGSGVSGIGGTAGSTNGGGGAGVVGFGSSGNGTGAPGVGVRGTGGGFAPNQASGVVGLNNSTPNAAVLGQNSGPGDGVFGNSVSGIGVHGFSNTQTAVYGNSLTGVGARGDSQQGPGVLGTSTINNGVFGLSGSGNGVYGQSGNGNGVLGQATSGGNGVQGLTTSGVGLYGSAGAGTGVFGTSVSGAGVAGSSANNNAVFGDASAAGNGVFARTVNGNALVAQATGGGNAASFFGNVIVNGNFTVMPGFAKSGAVTFPDGSVRRLYATEMPESWFEDVGEAQLVNGRASVPIPPDFAQAVNTGTPYYVFLTPHSEDVEALAVTVRAADHFEVRANGKGVVEGSFAYRIIAKRKGGAAPRFERVTGTELRPPLASDAVLRLPAAPEPPKPFEVPELPASARQIPPLQPVPEPPAEPRKLGR